MHVMLKIMERLVTSQIKPSDVPYDHGKISNWGREKKYKRSNQMP